MSEYSSSRRRLLFVVNVGWFFLSHRLALAIAAARDYEVHVACGIENPAEAEKIRMHGLQFHRLDLVRSSLSPMGALRVMWQLREVIALVRPDIVHLVAVKTVLLGGLVARFMRVPRVICAFSGLGAAFTARTWASRIAQRMLLRLYRLALGGKGAIAIFQNDEDRCVFTSANAISVQRTVVIRGVGVDLTEFPVTPEPTGTPVVVLATRMLRDKGVVEFAGAARRLLSAGIKATFVLAGAPDPANPSSLTAAELIELASVPGMEWRGHVSNMPALLASASIVCLPSYREGLPKVLVEAASAGRAIVATNVPGCRDVVVDGKTGLLVPPRDVVSLADALRSLIECREARSRMGANGRELMERFFDERDVIASVLQLYAH